MKQRQLAQLYDHCAEYIPIRSNNMFSRMKALAAATAVAGVVALAGAGSASAVNVGTIGTPIGSGTMSIAGSAGASRLVVNGTVALNCTDTRATGNISTGAFGAPTVTIGTIQPLFSNTGGADCVGPSGFLFGVNCVAVSSLEITANPSGGVTVGRISGIHCTVTFTALGCTATVTGTVPGSYANPTVSTPGVLTVNTAGQALTVSNSTCPSAVLPNGTGQYGAPVGTGTGLANLPYTLTGASSGHPFLS